MAKRAFISLVIVCALFCVAHNVLFAQTGGKLAGVVTDEQTGEPLIGANVVVRGTSLGASTDLDGNYFVLNIPAGKYEVQVSMVGYERVIVRDVIINSGRTTTLNVQLKQTAIEQEAVVVEAVRPDVEKEKTSTSAVVRPEEVQSLAGVRDVADVIGLAADVTDGHFRGGRTNEELYVLQGMGINNPLDNSSAFMPIVSAVEEIEVITSGFDAQYGNAQSGVVNITMKEGKPDKWRSRFESRVKMPGNKYWGPSPFDVKAQPYLLKLSNSNFWRYGDFSNGYQPLMNWMNMLFAGDTNVMVHATRVVWDKITSRDINKDYSRKLDYSFEGATGGPIDNGVTMFIAFRSNVESPILPTEEPDQQRQVMGNIAFDLGSGAAFKVSGGYQQQYENYFGGGTAFYNYVWDRILGIQYRLRTNHQLGFRFTKALSAKSFYDIKLNSLRTENRLGSTPWYDVITDAVRNMETGTAIITRTGNLLYYQNITGKTFSYLGNNYGNFQNERTITVSLDASYTNQITTSHLLNAGIQANYYVLRVDNIGSINSKGSITQTKYTGYPWEAGIYVQDKMEFEGMIAKVGLRWDVWNSNNWYYEDMFNPFNVRDAQGNVTDVQDPERAPKKKAKPVGRLQPRIGISFPVSMTTVFHLNYGTFLQRPPFQYMIGSRMNMLSTTTTPNTLGNPRLEPQSTNSYDVGVMQGLGEGFTLDVSGWYKDVKHLVEQVIFTDQIRGVSYNSYFNRDYADIRGFRVVLTKRRGVLTGSLNYQYSVATGKSSSPVNAPWGIKRDLQGNVSTDISKVPLRDVLLNFDRTHNLILTLAYATGEKWGPKFFDVYPFSSMVFSVRSFARSGRPYTPSGQATEINTRRTPNEYETNIRITKTLKKFLGMQASIYAEIFNVFNNKIYDYNYVFNTANKTDANQILVHYERYPFEDMTNGILYYDNYAEGTGFACDHSFVLYDNSPRSFYVGISIEF
ncbi:MAG: carboxypeptidase-like regulatory domain-containing protein [Bacteroidetes bacterium]|nr:carboxypeptidase-like regulatory domain-containing protein [Bacteroidota bacterium]